MRLHESRHIARSPEDVFAYTADFANSAEWDPGVAAASMVGGGPVGEGTKYELDVSFGPRRVPMTYEIVEYDAPRRVVLTGTGDTVEAVDVISFESVEGGTLVDYTADITLNNWLRLLGPLLGPAMNGVGKRALDGLVDSLER